MKKFWKIILIIIGTIFFIFIALIGIGVFVDFEYDDHIENGRYTYVPEDENNGNEYIEFNMKDNDRGASFKNEREIRSGASPVLSVNS